MQEWQFSAKINNVCPFRQNSQQLIFTAIVAQDPALGLAANPVHGHKDL